MLEAKFLKEMSRGLTRMDADLKPQLKPELKSRLDNGVQLFVFSRTYPG
jgi:hypothetical protein